MNLESTIIFTDGSSKGNPGPGGFGAIVIAPKNYELGIMNYEVREIGGREEHTTNNRMELRAAIEALEMIHDSRFTIQVYSDSSYLINGITKWIFGWQKNGWKKADKSEVENQDLWEKLYLAVQGKKNEWKYVGGHIGVAGNERCDQIATSFADGEKINLYHGSLENYPIKNILDVSSDTVKEKTKSNSKSSFSKKAFSYVSLVEGVIQTHKTWDECERRVKGKSGAKFKKVFSKEDEKDLIKSWE